MILNNEQRRLFKKVMEKYGYNSTLWLVDYQDTAFKTKKDMEYFLFQVFGIQGDFIFEHTSALSVIDSIINRYSYGQRKFPVTQERRNKLKALIEKLKDNANSNIKRDTNDSC